MISIKISASFLSIKDNLKENINILTNLDISYLHLDIMDGMFVPNKTYDINKIKEIINFKKPLDIHLMVSDVYKYVSDFITLKPEFITFHYEANCDIMNLINYIKSNGVKVGIAINPETDVKVLDEYLKYLDLILVMSVTPGRGGQKFIPSSIDKINYLNNVKKEFGYNYLISVDGGINLDTIKFVKTDIAVIGSYLTSGNMKENLLKIKESL